MEWNKGNYSNKIENLEWKPVRKAVEEPVWECNGLLVRRRGDVGGNPFESAQGSKEIVIWGPVYEYSKLFRAGQNIRVISAIVVSRC